MAHPWRSARAPDPRWKWPLGSVVLGHTRNLKDIWVPPEMRTMHMHLIGATGGGKSKCLEGIIRQDILELDGVRRSVIVLDPHGTLIDDLINWYTSHGLHRVRRIRVLDPSDPTYTFGLNPVRRREGVDPAVVASAVVNAMAKVWGGEDPTSTPQLRESLKAIVFTLCELGLTLADADALVSIEDNNPLRRMAIEKTKHASIRRFWRTIEILKPRERDEKLGSAVRRLNEFLLPEVISGIIGQRDQVVDFRQAMDNGEVILINLKFDAGRFSEDEATLLGTLIVADVFLSCLGRPKGALPVFVTIDECQRFLTQDVANILDQARKFGVHLTLSHQHVGHLREASESIYRSVMTNTRTKIVFGGLDDEDATLMARNLFRGQFDLQRPKKLYNKPVMVDSVPEWLLSESDSAGTARAKGKSATYGESDAISESVTTSASTTWSESDTVSESTTFSESDTISLSHGVSQSVTDSSSLTDSDSRTRSATVGRNESSTTGDNWTAGNTSSTTQSASDTTSQASTRSHTAGRSNSYSDGRNWSVGTGRAATNSQGDSSGDNYRVYAKKGFFGNNVFIGDEWLGRNEGRSSGSARTESTSASDGGSTAHAYGTSESTGYADTRGCSHTAGVAHSTGESRSIGGSVAHSTGISASNGVADTRGTARTQGTAETAGTTDTMGLSHSSGVATTQGIAHTVGIARTEGSSFAEGTTHTTSWSNSDSVTDTVSNQRTQGRAQTLRPVLKVMPTQPYSLEDLVHIASVRLANLNQGEAIVKIGKRPPARIRTLRIRDGWARPEHVARVKEQLAETTPYIMHTADAKAQQAQERKLLESELRLRITDGRQRQRVAAVPPPLADDEWG